MQLEPDKPSEIRTGSGVARVFAMLTIVALAAMTILVVLDVIPRAAFGETAARASMIIGVCALSALAIGFLSRR
jgi:uncharacterized membrane protein YcjF (UPF0283 family)